MYRAGESDRYSGSSGSKEIDQSVSTISKRQAARLSAFFKLSDMGTMAAYLRKLEAFDLNRTTGRELAKIPEKIKDLNIKQLMAGQDRYGKPLSPKYSQDPYFKTAAQARQYADWKKRLYPETPYDTPNLIIRGDYHNSIVVDGDEHVISFYTNTTINFGISVESKYKGNQLGLTPKSRKKAWMLVRNKVVQAMKQATSGK